MFERLNQYFRQLEFNNLIKNRVFLNLLTVSTITLLLKGIGFYKETLVASSFGLNKVLDTFLIAFLVPGFIMNVFIGAFKNVFIPNYIAEVNTGNKISSFQSTGFLITGVISLFFILIAYIFTDVYLEVLYPGHSDAYYLLIKSQFYYSLPCIIFWGYSSLLSGILNINEEFRLSSYAGVFIPITIIIFILNFQHIFSHQVLAIGTLVGSVFSFVYLLICCLKMGLIHLSIPSVSNANTRLMLAQVPAKVSSGFLTGMLPVVDHYFAAQLVVGSLASLNYGEKIPFVLLGLLVIPISNVLLPYFSKKVLADRKKSFQTLFKMLGITFFGGLFFSILAILFSDVIVEIAFQRNAFTSRDTQIVSNIQKILLIYVPFSMAGMITVNFLTSINKNAFMAYIALGGLLLNILLDYVFIDYYGILGIALSTTVIIVVRNIALFKYAYDLRKTV